MPSGLKPVVTTCRGCGKDMVTINPDEDFYCNDCRHPESESDKLFECEMCQAEMLPNTLKEFMTGKVIPVHVCPNCGLVTRDSDRLNIGGMKRP